MVGNVLEGKLVPPCAYQGGKQRIAAPIVDLLLKEAPTRVADLCCGSGAVSIELVNRGLSPTSLVMVDKGPWGYFWQSVGDGTFQVEGFKAELVKVPTDPRGIQAHIQALSRQPVPEMPRLVYVFLLLQASAFGSKAIWIDASGTVWQNTTFRSFWEPTATSNRRSHVNPMMPMPETLFARVEVICSQMRGVKGWCGDVMSVVLPPDCLVYVDPPYLGTTGYGHEVDVFALAKKLGRTIVVSEGKALSSKAIQISDGRKKGGISGERAEAAGEWLSWVGASC